jgi:hypothetical protein
MKLHILHKSVVLKGMSLRGWTCKQFLTCRRCFMCFSAEPWSQIWAWVSDEKIRLKDSGYRQPHLGGEEEKGCIFNADWSLQSAPQCFSDSRFEPLLQRTRNNSQDPQKQYARLEWVLIPNMSLIRSAWLLCEILIIFVHLQRIYVSWTKISLAIVNFSHHFWLV